MTSDDVSIPHSLIRVSAIREPSNWIASSRPIGGQICSKLHFRYDDVIMMTSDDVLMGLVECCMIGWVRWRHQPSDTLWNLCAKTPRSPNHLWWRHRESCYLERVVGVFYLLDEIRWGRGRVGRSWEATWAAEALRERKRKRRGNEKGRKRKRKGEREREREREKEKRRKRRSEEEIHELFLSSFSFPSFSSLYFSSPFSFFFSSLSFLLFASFLFPSNSLSSLHFILFSSLPLNSFFLVLHHLPFP